MASDCEQAVIRALSVLAWVVGQEELLPVFLGATGASEADLRLRADEPDFLASVLDFVLMDDAWVIACAQDLGLAPERIVEIRAGLPGGGQTHWT